MHKASYKMLVVEDDPEVRDGLQSLFEMEGYKVSVASDGDEGLRRIRQRPEYDIALLDIMLPEKNGFDLLRTARSLGIRTPILMLTAYGGEKNILTGFELGAEDYVVKPFNPDVLLARVRAILRRTAPPSEAPMDVWHCREVEVNFSTHEAFRNGARVAMTRQEYELLRYLVHSQGRTLTRDQLLREVWGISDDVVTRTVDRHIASLRKKIESDAAHPTIIETIYGQGYRFNG